MNDVSIIAIITALLIIAMIVATIRLHHRFPGGFGIMVAGALGFVLTQVLLHVPLFIELGIGDNVVLFMVSGLFTALAAGVGRYLIVRWTLSDKLSWGGAVCAGTGHGFCEALFLFVFFYSIEIMVMQIGEESGEILVEALFNRSLAYVFVDFIAQISAIGFHIAMYLIIVNGILKNQAMKGLLLVCGLQILYTFFKYYFVVENQNLWMCAAAVILIGVLSCIYLIQTYRSMEAKNQIDFEKDEGEKALEEGY